MSNRCLKIAVQYYNATKPQVEIDPVALTINDCKTLIEYIEDRLRKISLLFDRRSQEDKTILKQAIVEVNSILTFDRSIND